MKNITTIPNLLIMVIIILFFNGCKEKDCHKDGTCAPDYRKMPLGEAKSYLWSLPGSYWIYKNSATGDLDTQVCTGFLCDTIIVKGTDKETQHITIEYERILRSISSSFNNFEYYEETSGYNPNVPRPLMAILNRSLHGFSSTIFWHPFEKIDGTAIIFKGFDSTLIIQGLSYNYVAKFEVALDGVWENSPPYTGSAYYWAKNVGLVKRFAKNKPDDWEIVEYQIIK